MERYGVFQTFTAAALVVSMLAGCRVLVQAPGPRPDPEPESRSTETVCKPGTGPPAHAPAHGYRRKCAYRYYPRVEVYHSVEAEVYFWKAEGQWNHGQALPETVRLEGESVRIELETDRPYTRHEEVVKKYGGSNPPNGPPGHAKNGPPKTPPGQARK